MQQKSSVDTAVRWNIRVSSDTDVALRNFLGEQELKSGGLARFIEEAVRARVFQLTVEDIQSRNAKTDPSELLAVIDEAVRDVRRSGSARISPQRTVSAGRLSADDDVIHGQTKVAS